MNSNVIGASAADNGVLDQLPYFVEWRSSLWTPAVRWLLGDVTRFRGKRVLEPGCRSGRMSCLFGLLGAQVLGVDLPGVSLEPARREAQRAGVSDHVRFVTYDGNPASLPGGDFDFIFTKSMLVMLPELKPFLAALAPKLKADGELLAAENLEGGWLRKLVRRFVYRRRDKSFLRKVHGVNAAFLDTFGEWFEIVEQQSFWWIVIALRARRACPGDR